MTPTTTRQGCWFAATLALVVLTTSCASKLGERDATLKAVPVPTTWELASDDAPEELRLAEGEDVVRQTYTIHHDGRFLFNRTIQREEAALGVRGRNLDAKKAESLGIASGTGVLVSSIKKDGPGSKAGLLKDDVIRTFDSKEVHSVDQLEELIRASKPGQKVDVGFARAGTELKVTVELAATTRVVAATAFERQLPVVNDSNHSGLVLAELTDEVRPIVRGTAGPERGLLVTGMLVGGPAFFSKIRHRDLIVRIDDVPVETIDDFLEVTANARESGSTVTVAAKRGTRDVETEIQLSRNARREIDFNALGLISWESRANKREFRLLWGLLCHDGTRYSITETPHGGMEHQRHREWGVLLNLFRFEVNPHRMPRRTEVLLLWVIPLSLSDG